MRSNTLAPIIPGSKIMLPTFRRASRPDGPTRMECWGANLLGPDGVTVYVAERVEDTGTPWQVRRADGAWGGWWTLGTSLRNVRLGVASGAYEREYELDQHASAAGR